MMISYELFYDAGMEYNQLTKQVHFIRGGNKYLGTSCRPRYGTHYRPITRAIKLRTGTHGNTVIASKYQLGH